VPEANLAADLARCPVANAVPAEWLNFRMM
jgi:hypothetical protein